MKKLLVLLCLIFVVTMIAACEGVPTTTTTTTTSATTTTTTTTTTSTTTTTPTTSTTTVSTLTDQQIVDGVYDWLNLGDLTALTNTSPRLIMPAQRDGVAITWVISNTSYIAVNGVITQPANELGNQTVTLTATLTKGVVTRTKVFTATIVALPPVEETLPILLETFSDYADGNIIPQTTGVWGPVSNKTGSSQFYVVSSITGTTIPDGSKALQINAFTELQIEAALVHTYDLVIIEADVYQTAGGSPLYIQSSSSSPVVAFGLTGGNTDSGSVYYRTDNGTMIETAIELNTWYKVRFEVNLVNKTIELFYYDEDGNLIPCTPGPVTYTGATGLTSLFIRSGSSTTIALNENPSYVTNIVANRIEALPRPEEVIKMGQVTGLEEEVTIENGLTFVPAEPVILNYYGSQSVLVKDTDYTVVIDNPVDTVTDGEYTVTYTITNVNDSLDVLVFTQTVTVYSPATPNVINSVSSTVAGAMTHKTTLTVNLLRAEGTLHYVVSSTPLNGDEIVASLNKVSVTVTGVVMTLEGVVVEVGKNVYLVIELNGLSNVISQMVTHQEIVNIATPQEFYDAVHRTESEQTGKYFLLTSDLDFTGFTWVSASNKFVAVLDGANHVISNLTINKVGVKGGIFSFLENATIKNLVLDNITTTSDTTASGLLSGEIKGVTLIENIVILNSSNIVNNEYGAILCGRVRSSTPATFATFKNITVVDTYMETQKNYGGGLVAGMDTSTSTVFEDIFMMNFTIKEATNITVTGQMVGSIIGRVQGPTRIERVVGYNVNVTGLKNVGGIIGKSDEIGVVVTLSDIYISGSITYTGMEHANVLVGNISDQTPVATNAWASGFSTIGALGLPIVEGNLIDSALTEVQTWWTTNISSILTSPLWSFSGNMVLLNNYATFNLPSHDVTINYNMGPIDEVLILKEGSTFTYVGPSVPGYVFVGWYSDVALTTPLTDPFVISGPVTIYGKYETSPASTVSFDTGEAGVLVDAQMVNYGDLATLPVVPQTMISGVLKEVVGWQLNSVDFDFSTPITTDITLIPVWQTVVFTVSFEGGETQSVAYGELATAPLTDPVHPLSSIFASITFQFWTLSDVEYDFATPVTSNLTLNVGWLIPAVLGITTTDQFYYTTTVGTTLDYELLNDLDFTGFTWTISSNGIAFTGSLDGNGFTISNLTITGSGSGVYGGIFQRTNGATIHGLIIDNANVSFDGRGGVLIGRIETSTTTVYDIVIKNSSVAGTAGEGVGILVGNASLGFIASNITILNSTATNSNKNVAFLIGRADNVVTLTDIYVFGSSAESTATPSTDHGVAGIIGYTNNANVAVTLTRIVLEDCTLKGRSVGSLIGYFRYGTLTATDVFTDITFVYAGTDGQQGIIGRRNVDANTTDPVLTNVFAHFVDIQVGAGVQLNPANVLADLSSMDEAWWTTNIPNILASEIWSFRYVFAALDDAIPFMPVMYEVTIYYNMGPIDEVILVRADSIFSHTAPVESGYVFIDWYSDAAFTTLLGTEYAVTGPVTIYGKYETAPDSTVSFDSGIEGVDVTSQMVGYGLLATLPVVPQTMVGGVLKEVVGWQLSSVDFDFATPITADITLVAVWDTVTYTISFEGGDSQVVAYGDLATAPLTDPVHPLNPVFASIVFQYWTLSGTEYDFATPVTSNLSLTISWATPSVLEITTLDQFYYTATTESTFTFELMNDLDFTGYSWVDTGSSFKGTFDGGGFVILNLTINATNGYGGIFARANGATISNLVLNSVNITTTARAGILVGRIENGSSTITNILIMNSSATSADSNGLGGLIGQVSVDSFVSNIALLSTTLTSTNKNVGGLVGRIDGGSLIADDIYIDTLYATSTSTASSDVGLGGVVGYVRNSAASMFGGTRIVVKNTILDGNAAGAFIGYLYYPGTAALSMAYFEVTFVNGERTGFIGYTRDQIAPFDQTSVFGSLTDAVTHSQVVNLTNTAIPDSNTWWQTNISDIYNGALWTVNVDGSVVLNIAS